MLEQLSRRRWSLPRWSVACLVGTCACLIAGAVTHAFASGRPDYPDRRSFFPRRRLDEQHERRQREHDDVRQQSRRVDDEPPTATRRLQRRGVFARGGGGVGGKKRFALDPPSSATAAATETASAGGYPAAGFDPNSNVCLLTIMTQERMASLHRMLYQWDGYVSIALLVDSYDDAAGEQRTRGR